MSLFFRHCLWVIFLIISLNSCEWNPHYRVKTQIIQLKSTDEIVLINRPLVRPLIYTHISGLEKLPTHEAKAKFISAILPSILVARFDIHQNEKQLKRLRRKIQWEKADSIFYDKVRKQYRAKNINDLLVRMRTPPVSIVLAQAAIESGWGQSRIFTKANNVFGVWSFNSHEPRIAALVKRGNKRVYLKSYATMSQSVTNYFEIIGRAKSFEKLREMLAITNDPMVIVPYFKNYSERRTAYTRQLKLMIQKNNLTLYDQYSIDPACIIAVK